MANIRVDLKHTPRDGEPVSFKAPCDASNITGLSVYYMNTAGETESQEFTLTDANGGDLGVLDCIFAEGAIVKVLLDMDTHRAFVQNADTNAYLEGRFDGISFNGRKGAVLPQSGDYTAAMVGAAPAGYGLGNGSWTSVTDCNEMVKNGWWITQNGTANAPVAAEAPTRHLIGEIFTISRGNTNKYIHQTFFAHTDSMGFPKTAVLERDCDNGTWGEWGYVNPPMVEGVEYRTTERYNGKPVYQAAFSLSIPTSFTSGTVAYPTLANGSTIMAVDLLDATVLGTPTANGQRRFIPQTGEPTYTVGHAQTEMCQVFASVGTTSAGGSVGLRYFFGTGISPHGKTLIGSVKYTKE